jgi:pimeloyl-ACP methyl ester carboxylesterase
MKNDLIKYGNGTNKIFLISGMFAGSWVWKPMLEKMEPSQVTVYAMQEALCEVSSDFDQLCDHIIGLIKTQFSEPVVLVGNSLGGLLALMITSKAPELTKRIIVSGAPGEGPINMQIGKPKPNDVAYFETMREIIFYDGSCMTQKDFETTMTLWQNKRSFINIVRMMKNANFVNVEKIVKSIEIPIVGIWGANDVITPPSYWDELFCRLGHIFCKIGFSGHSPMYEKPESFAKIMQLAVDS